MNCGARRNVGGLRRGLVRRRGHSFEPDCHRQPAHRRDRRVPGRGRRLERRFRARRGLAEDAAAALARARRATSPRASIVDPYAIEVELRNGHYAPKALREAIRAAGPTVRRDLGKQAEGLAPVAAAHAPTERLACIAMTNSTPPSSPRASASSATRSARRLAGELTEDQFRPHRLMNGLYLQLHSYMLRIAVPYGTLNSRQMRKLAEIARKYDRGYGHFTTRQNLQFNWPALKDVPDILAELASVEMHAIQTSGNCIRNVTADHFAGVAADETRRSAPVSPKSCGNGRRCTPSSRSCRASSRSPSTARRTTAPSSRRTTSACRSCATTAGELGFAVYVGGGLGRTPFIGHKVRDFLPQRDLLAYCRGDPARLQSRGPARQQVQGAHQDPAAREGPRGAARGGRGGIRRARRRVARTAGRRGRAHRRLFRAAAARAARARRTSGSNAGAARTRSSPSSSSRTSRRTRFPATPSSPCR